MKVIITGGGTAGHVTPLLAIASELKRTHPQSKIRYIGKIGDPMRKLIREQRITEKQYYIFAGKWRRYHGLSTLMHLSDIKTLAKNMRDLFLFILGFIQSFFILLFWRPNIVFVKGGYVGLPVGLAAGCLRIPIVTHDSDSLPGLTNRLISHFAKLMAVGMSPELYDKYYPKDKVRFTGVPIRAEFQEINNQPAKIAARKQLGISNGMKVVAIIGGSLGAVHLNNAVLINLAKLLSNPSVFVIWITGRRQYDNISKKIDILTIDKNRLQTYVFTSELHTFIAAADIVVSRAGATSIAELAAASKPTILVPNPYLAAGHQSKNAQTLANSGAIVAITEKQLLDKPIYLSDEIFRLLDDSSLMQTLAKNLNNLAIKDAASRIVAVLDEAIKK